MTGIEKYNDHKSISWQTQINVIVLTYNTLNRIWFYPFSPLIPVGFPANTEYEVTSGSDV